MCTYNSPPLKLAIPRPIEGVDHWGFVSWRMEELLQEEEGGVDTPPTKEEDEDGRTRCQRSGHARLGED